MAKRDYFEYPVPYLLELKEMYIVPYRFSAELQASAYYIYTHPNFRWSKLFYNLHKKTDMNDMLKSAYLIIRYYQDHPQQFNHTLNNVVPQISVSMWKAFLSLNKHLRGNQFSQYHSMDFKRIDLFENKFLDIFLEDIRTGNYIGHNDEMVKERPNIGLRDRRSLGTHEGGKTFEYLSSLE